ncbi:hypothetical protein GCM10027046_25940 [Uliginosibacterium flavum]
MAAVILAFVDVGLGGGCQQAGSKGGEAMGPVHALILKTLLRAKCKRGRGKHKPQADQRRSGLPGVQKKDGHARPFYAGAGAPALIANYSE